MMKPAAARRARPIAARCQAFAAAAALAVLAPAALAQDGVPVMLDDQGEDACGTGIVTGLNPAGDNYLTVRSGPGSDYAGIDRLEPDTLVAMCDSDGDWIGIVYGGDECRGGSPAAVTQNGPYEGPCGSGWVFGQYVQLLAG